jgi:hypothetical protein
MEEFPRPFVYNKRKENIFMKRMFYLSLALMLAVSFVLAAVNVTGEWDLTRKTPQGDRTSPITFTQDGEKLTVKMTGRNGEEITGAGTVKGNDIEWSITRTTPQGEFTMVYKGKIDGDKMAGTFDMRGTPVEWTAARKVK